MSRILAYTSPQYGHLFPLVPILEELRQRGHDVALRASASGAETMRSLGFDANPVAPAIEALGPEDWRARSPIGGARLAAAHFCNRAEHEIPDLQRAIAQERPDALLVDILTWGALSAAEAWGGPWAAFSPLLPPLPSHDAPPFGPGFRPARGPLGRLRDRQAQALSRIGMDRLICPRLNPLRARLGLPPFRHGHEMFLAPPLLLYLSAGGFEYERSDWPENVVMVGPCPWDPPAELPDALRDVEAPFVLVTTSSEFQDDSRLVRTALAALTNTRYHVVATLPVAPGVHLRPRPDATVLPFAPHAPILARSACAITHGGMGITQKALSHGVPVCAVPFGRDQYDVARRVEVAGAGSRLPSWRLRPDRLRAKVHEAISKRAGAERVAEAFASAGGPAVAADAFERRLRER